MRGDREIEVPVPGVRRVIAVLVLLAAVGILSGILPWGPGTVGCVLLLIAAGLLV